ALGVDVGELLELERALQRDGVLQATPEVEEVRRVRQVPGQPGDLAVEVERLLDQAWDLDQVRDALAKVLGVDGASQPTEPEREQIAGLHHGAEGLGDATPSSGPACMYSVPVASRERAEPTTLVMARIGQP